MRPRRCWMSWSEAHGLRRFGWALRPPRSPAPFDLHNAPRPQHHGCRRGLLIDGLSQYRRGGGGVVAAPVIAPSAPPDAAPMAAPAPPPAAPPIAAPAPAPIKPPPTARWPGSYGFAQADKASANANAISRGPIEAARSW